MKFILIPLHGILKYHTKMKKVFALLTIVSVMSFVACKNQTKDNHAADSAKQAESLENVRVQDSIKMAADAAAAAADTTKKDTATAPAEVK